MSKLKDGDFVNFIEQLQQESLNKLRNNIQQNPQKLNYLNKTNKDINKIDNNNKAVINKKLKQNSYTNKIINQNRKTTTYQIKDPQIIYNSRIKKGIVIQIITFIVVFILTLFI